jgi:ElaB/YqjD/DUF883 family membrane-anchored ribosome-binding protein
MGMRHWVGSSNGGAEQVTVDKLRDDLRLLATDMEQLLKATANNTSSRMSAVRARAQESLSAAKARVTDAQENAWARACSASKASSEYVRDNPWQVLAVVAAAGLVLGFFLARPSEADA